MTAATAATGLHRASAFTLIEVLIVVVILAVLAMIVVPQFLYATEGAQQTAFITDLRTFAVAAERYMNETGELLEDAGSGQVPAGWQPYIRENQWTSITAIGGVWDAQQNEMGITSAIGVHFNGSGETRDDTYMLDIDRLYDDGDLTTGGFRKIANDRYYLILRR